MNKQKIAVIDGDFLAFVCLTKNLDIIEACNLADNFLHNLLQTTYTTDYVGFIGGSPDYRKQIDPNYKLNRVNNQPLPYLTEFRSYLVDKWKFNWLNIVLPQNIYETDDYVASYVSQVPNSFIISPDKDLLNLKGTHYNPIKNLWVTTTKQDSEIYFWKTMITGDTADNIKGLPSKGGAFYKNLIKNVDLELDYNLIINEIFTAYMFHYKYEALEAIEEFYKNFKLLSMKKDLDITQFKTIPYEKFNY